MTTIRVATRQRFTTIDRQTVNNDQLSFRARGVLLWLLDKPDDWTCSAETLARAGTEGRDAIRSALTELETLGYLIRERRQDKTTGQWASSWTIYETPGHAEDGFPGLGDPESGDPDLGEPGLLQKTDYQKTETETSSLSPSAASGLFEEWWALYRQAANTPGSKGDAVKAWMKLKLAEKQAALEGIERHLGFMRTAPNLFVMPHGATWLNKARWMDDRPQQPPRKTSAAMDSIRARMQELNHGAL